MPFDRARFPTLALYLNRVGGLEALPACQSKASIVRGLLADHPLHTLPNGALPKQLQAFVREPPPMNVWVSEVLGGAIHCAAYDFSFKSPAEAAAATVRTNLRLFQLSVYRALMMVVTPSLLLRAASARWAAFHRGSTLTVRESTAHSAVAALDFPPHLFIPENPLDVRAALEASLIAAGGKEVTVVAEEFTATSMVYRATF